MSAHSAERVEASTHKLQEVLAMTNYRGVSLRAVDRPIKPALNEATKPVTDSLVLFAKGVL